MGELLVISRALVIVYSAEVFSHGLSSGCLLVQRVSTGVTVDAAWGCALAKPGGPWHPTLAFGHLRNLWIFLNRYPMLNTLKFTGSEHPPPLSFSQSTALTLKMTTPQVVETAVAINNNSPISD